MLTYHHLIHVMEYLREQGASQSALDDVLTALWEETESQRQVNGGSEDRGHGLLS